MLKRRSVKREGTIDAEEGMTGWICLPRFHVLIVLIVLEISGHLRTCRLGVTT